MKKRSKNRIDAGKSMGNRIVIGLLSFYLLLPIGFTFIYSIFTEWNDVLPKGLTFRFYRGIFSDGQFWSSLFKTVGMAIVPVLVCTVVVLSVMYVVVVYLPGLEKYVQIICTIPYAIQGVIIAISVLSLYADALEPLSNRLLMLVSTYSIVILPYIYQGIKNSMNTVNAPCLLEAAQMLGASRLYAFFRVIVPNLMSGVTVSAMLSTAIVFGDFVVMNIVGGSYVETAQIYLFSAMRKSGQLASAIIIVLFTVTLVGSATVFFLKSKATDRKGGTT